MTYHEVSPAAAYAARASARVIDVREPDEFHGALGHIPGAELVPLAKVATSAASWDRTAPVVLVCRSGGRSSRAARALLGVGFEHVLNLSGGMLAYNAAGLPVERS
jgi:rhodanese-related sulfurtransferase